MFDKFRRRFRRMNKLRIDEVSAVDFPPAEPATVRIIKRHGGDDIKKIVRSHTEALAHEVADIMKDTGVTDKAEAMSEAFETFAEDITKRVSFRGEGAAHEKLRASFDDVHRANPHFTPEANYATAWRSLSDAERDGIRAEEMATAARKETERRAYAEATIRANKSFSEGNTNMDIISKLTKSIIEGGNAGISEADLTKIGFEHAQKFRRDNETREMAFARFYEDDLDFRKAIAITNGRPIQSGNYQHTIAKSDVEDPLGELNKLAADLRKRKPELSKAQAFAKIYETHPELAHAERLQNRPTA